jgi:hypothetical protein
MSNEQQELLYEVFLNYWKKVSVNNEEDCLVKQEEGSFLKEVRVLYQQEFIDKCKTDTEFSERWGLKIDERELSLEERYKIALPIWKEKYGLLANMMVPTNVDNTPYKIPTKQITVTYNNKTIESYE